MSIESSLFSVAPWYTIQVFQEFAVRTKQAAMPEHIDTIAVKTTDYEKLIRQLWETFKQDPTEANAKAFIDHIVTASDQVWEEFMKEILEIEDFLDHHSELLSQELDEHKWYFQNSLYPDLLKEIGKGREAFDHYDHRVIFMYAGALWSFGMLSTVMFDGLNVRDLADLFIFSGPDDESTCTGERGCHQHVGKVYTVAQILADNIIPGKLRCLTNCRHVLIPVASPLNE